MKWKLRLSSRRTLESLPSFRFSSFSTSDKSWERGAKLVKNIETENQYLEQIRATHDPSMHLKTLEDELRGTMGKALGKQGEKVVNSLLELDKVRNKYYKYMLSFEMPKESSRSACDDNGNSTENKLNRVIQEDGGGGDDGESNNELKIQNISFKSLPTSTQTKIVQLILAFNKHRNDATQARWELTVHRQAVGFIVNNHKFVQDKFPIPPPLSLPFDFDQSLISNKSYSPYNNEATQQQSTGKEAVSRKFGDQLDWWERIGRWR